MIKIINYKTSNVFKGFHETYSKAFQLRVQIFGYHIATLEDVNIIHFKSYNPTFACIPLVAMVSPSNEHLK